jgi:hypothetical protein
MDDDDIYLVYEEGRKKDYNLNSSKKYLTKLRLIFSRTQFCSFTFAPKYLNFVHFGTTYWLYLDV